MDLPKFPPVRIRLGRGVVVEGDSLWLDPDTPISLVHVTEDDLAIVRERRKEFLRALRALERVVADLEDQLEVVKAAEAALGILGA